MQRPATIRDVARLAAVHAATASRALNPDRRVMLSRATVDRVVDAARTLGHQPNSAARSLRTRTSSVAGVLIPDLVRRLHGLGHTRIGRWAASRHWPSAVCAARTTSR